METQIAQLNRSQSTLVKKVIKKPKARGNHPFSHWLGFGFSEARFGESGAE